MTSFAIQLRPLPTVSASPSLGSQISMSLDVTRASTAADIARFLPVASHFAEKYCFDLPALRDVEARNSIVEFKNVTVPRFISRMQPIFDRRIAAMAGASNVYDDFRIHEMGGVDLPEAVKAGLVSFDSAAALLDAVASDANGLLSAIPPYRPAANPYYKLAPVIGRAAFVGAMYSAGLLFTDSLWGVGGVTTGMVVAMETAACLHGRKVMQSRLLSNRQTAVRTDGIYNTLQRVSVLRLRLNQVKDDAPADLSRA